MRRTISIEPSEPIEPAEPISNIFIYTFIHGGTMAEKKKGLTYAEAGVDIDAGEREVELIDRKSVV